MITVPWPMWAREKKYRSQGSFSSPALELIVNFRFVIKVNHMEEQLNSIRCVNTVQSAGMFTATGPTQ